MDTTCSSNAHTPKWRDLSDAARADAYSPSSVLENRDPTPFIQQYKAASEAAYASCQSLQTISYGPKPSNTIDVVTPNADANAPLNVFIHGGYWQELCKRDSFFLAADTLSRHMAFAAVDYSLAPDATLDEIVEECCAALTCLFEQAEKLGIDRDRIVVSGSSAGAHLAAMSCLKLPQKARPKGVTLMSGVYELEPLIGTYVNDAVGMDVECAKRNSPALAYLDGFPPAVIAWGGQETDEFKRQSLHFADLLTASGVAVERIEMTERNHFDIVFDVTNQSELGQKFARLATTWG